MTQFVEAEDLAAMSCKQMLTEMGAMNVKIMTDGALRCCVSLNPMPDGWQWQASVSRNGKPVPAMEAMQVASRFVPQSLKVQKVDRQQHAMHVWFCS